MCSRLPADDRVLPQSRGHRAHRGCGGLAAHRRPREDGRAWFRDAHGPRQGTDHPWRREHLSGRGLRMPARDPRVAQVAVLGLPDERLGEVVAAVLVAPGEAGAALADELAELCARHLAPYKIPQQWHVATGVPTTASGKIQNFALREAIIRGELRARAIAALPRTSVTTPAVMRRRPPGRGSRRNRPQPGGFCLPIRILGDPVDAGPVCCVTWRETTANTSPMPAQMAAPTPPPRMTPRMAPRIRAAMILGAG